MAEVLDPTEVLEPSAQNLVVVLNKGTDNEIVLVQKPLSFFGKMEFFAVMGKIVEQALSEGSTISDLLDVPEQRGQLNTDDLRDADVFIKGVAKIVQYAPELIGDLYCVMLGVPRGERDFIKEEMTKHEDEGGLSDEEGFAIINTFIDQNWEVMVDFFSEKILPLVKKVSGKFTESTSSKSSKPTRRSTQKQPKNS